MERPRSLASAAEILEKYGSRAMVKAGGTDVLVWMRKHAVHPEVLVDLSEIPELKGISFYPHRGIKIGALATVNEAAENEDLKRCYPALRDACLSHSDVLIRNKATVLGNICASVPSGDLIPAFAVHEAVLHVFGPGGERDIFFSDFITGPRKNSLIPGEIVVSATLPFPGREVPDAISSSPGETPSTSPRSEWPASPWTARKGGPTGLPAGRWHRDRYGPQRRRRSSRELHLPGMTFSTGPGKRLRRLQIPSPTSGRHGNTGSPWWTS